MYLVDIPELIRSTFHLHKQESSRQQYGSPQHTTTSQLLHVRCTRPSLWEELSVHHTLIMKKWFRNPYIYPYKYMLDKRSVC